MMGTKEHLNLRTMSQRWIRELLGPRVGSLAQGGGRGHHGRGHVVWLATDGSGGVETRGVQVVLREEVTQRSSQAGLGCGLEEKAMEGKELVPVWRGPGEERGGCHPGQDPRGSGGGKEDSRERRAGALGQSGEASQVPSWELSTE